MPLVALLAVVVAVALILATEGEASAEGLGSPVIFSKLALLSPPGPLPSNAAPRQTLLACYTFGPFYGLNPDWLFWTAYLESKFVPGALNQRERAYGLTQLKDISIQTLRENGFDVPADWRFGIDGNIRAAAQYAKWLTANYEIPDAGVFREVWTLGPSAYFDSGERNPTEAAKIMKLVGA